MTARLSSGNVGADGAFSLDKQEIIILFVCEVFPPFHSAPDASRKYLSDCVRFIKSQHGDGKISEKSFR